MFCYIHIPFCESRCKYCRFSTFVEKDEMKKQFYVDYLVKSIEEENIKSFVIPGNAGIYKDITNPFLNIDANASNYLKDSCIPRNDKDILNSIYFWWWTPTSLSNKQLSKIIASLKNKYSFEKDIEITLETTPNNISIENLVEWEKIWVNRLSLWIQTLNDLALSEIWRIDKKGLIEKLEILKQSKIVNISLDFIIWLPYVAKGEVLDDLRNILENYKYVKHISLYMLEDYYDYPKTWEQFSIKEEDFLDEYVNCKSYLQEKWFYRYEVSNFAKKWYECKHNKAYWEHKDLVPYWLWAHWFLDNKRYAYSNNFNEYYKWKYDYLEKLNEKDLFLEKVMFWLRTNWLEENIYKKLNTKKINEFVENKMLEFNDEKLILKDKWTVLLDYIIKEIIC